MKKGIYLDYAASCPVDPRVMSAMEPFFTSAFGNPASLHSFGQEALRAIDGAREEIAKAFRADFREIIFTGSATEANNLALRGVVRGAARELGTQTPKLVVSAIEHESILETVHDLERAGKARLVVVPVDREGRVDMKELERALSPETVLVSIMFGNNEVGTLQPLGEVGRMVKNARVAGSPYPLFHSDAVQAFPFLDCDPRVFGLDMLTISAHKMYGPKGVGALYVRREKDGSPAFSLDPIITGGGQEFLLRSGTQGVPLIVGFGEAVRLTVNERNALREKVATQADYFFEELQGIVPGVTLNGPDASLALPHIRNVYFPQKDGRDLMVRWDLAGLAVGIGSACASRVARPSHVLRALGYSDERIRGSLRFSFGRLTEQKDIDTALNIIKISLEE